jgi:hypothetical protein
MRRALPDTRCARHALAPGDAVPHASAVAQDAAAARRLISRRRRAATGGALFALRWYRSAGSSVA